MRRPRPALVGVLVVVGMIGLWAQLHFRESLPDSTPRATERKWALKDPKLNVRPQIKEQVKKKAEKLIQEFGEGALPEPSVNWVLLVDEEKQRLRRVSVGEMEALLGDAIKPSTRHLLLVFPFRDPGAERWAHAATAIPYLHRHARTCPLHQQMP
jgi:hypothetical protein